MHILQMRMESIKNSFRLEPPTLQPFFPNPITSEAGMSLIGNKESRWEPLTRSSQWVGLVYVIRFQTKGVLLHSSRQSCSFLLFIPTI